MKFKIMMKDPDAPYDAVRDAAAESMPEGLSESEREILIESRAEELGSFLRRWMRYGEYLSVEFDTEAGTAVVLEDSGA